MRALISFAALLLSIMLVQLGVGVLAPLDALAGVARGFSDREIGLLGSAHFAGFFIGCLYTPALMARVGHSRAFAAITAIGVISTLLHPLTPYPEAWMVYRVGAGIAIAGSYTVVESWLQAKLENSNRARILSGYRVADMSAAVGSQLLIIQLDPLLYASYTVVALVAVVSLLPLTLTTAKPPPSPKRPKLRPWRAIQLSPLGAAGVIVTGLTSSSFRMVGPLYGAAFDLSREAIAYFLAAGMLGGAVAQPFVGWIADKFDRRWVLIGVSLTATAVCAVLSVGLGAFGTWTLPIGSFLFGAAAMPLYSISAAHANDHCPPDSVVELNAALLFMFAVGAIISPVLAAELVSNFGPNALWAYVGAAHLFLIVFGVYRMTRRPSPEARTAYRWLPRSSMILGRLFKKHEEPQDAPLDPLPERAAGAFEDAPPRSSQRDPI